MYALLHFSASHMNSERPLYILPFRAIVLSVLGVFLVGAAGGAVGAWLTVRRVLRVTPTGERIIERVERVTASGEETLSSAAEALVPATVAILDDRGRTVQHAVSATSDGVLVSAGAVPTGIARVRTSDGRNLPASVVRVYPDARMFFLKADGSFSVPAFEEEPQLVPGVVGAALASVSVSGSHGVQIAHVAAVRFAADRLHAAAPGLARVPVLERGLPPSFHSAPFVASNGRVTGLVVQEADGTYVIPASVVKTLLQDYLEHREETEVPVLAGLRGRWEAASGAMDAQLAFRVTQVASASRFADAGLRTGDEIRAVNGKAFDGLLPLVRPLLEAVRATAPTTLQVRRGTEERSVEIPPPS